MTIASKLPRWSFTVLASAVLAFTVVSAQSDGAQSDDPPSERAQQVAVTPANVATSANAWIAAVESIEQFVKDVRRVLHDRQRLATALHTVSRGQDAEETFRVLTTWRPEWASRLGHIDDLRALLAARNPRWTALVEDTATGLQQLARLTSEDAERELLPLKSNGFLDHLASLADADGAIIQAVARTKALQNALRQPPGMSKAPGASTAIETLSTQLEPWALDLLASVRTITALCGEGPLAISTTLPEVAQLDSDLREAERVAAAAFARLRAGTWALSERQVTRSDQTVVTDETRQALEAHLGPERAAGARRVVPAFPLEGPLFRTGEREFLLLDESGPHVLHGSLEEIRLVTRWLHLVADEVDPHRLAGELASTALPLGQRMAALAPALRRFHRLARRAPSLLEAYADTVVAPTVVAPTVVAPGRTGNGTTGKPTTGSLREEPLSTLRSLPHLHHDAAVAVLLLDSDGRGRELLAALDLLATHIVVEVAIPDPAATGALALWAKPLGAEPTELTARGTLFTGLVPVPDSNGLFLVGGELDGKPLRQTIHRLPPAPGRVRVEPALVTLPTAMPTAPSGPSTELAIDTWLERNRKEEEN